MILLPSPIRICTNKFSYICFYFAAKDPVTVSLYGWIGNWIRTSQCPVVQLKIRCLVSEYAGILIQGKVCICFVRYPMSRNRTHYPGHSPSYRNMVKWNLILAYQRTLEHVEYVDAWIDECYIIFINLIVLSFQRSH